MPKFQNDVLNGVDDAFETLMSGIDEKLEQAFPELQAARPLAGVAAPQTSGETGFLSTRFDPEAADEAADDNTSDRDADHGDQDSMVEVALGKVSHALGSHMIVDAALGALGIDAEIGSIFGEPGERGADEIDAFGSHEVAAFDYDDSISPVLPPDPHFDADGHGSDFVDLHLDTDGSHRSS